MALAALILPEILPLYMNSVKHRAQLADIPLVLLRVAVLHRLVITARAHPNKLAAPLNNLDMVLVPVLMHQ